jgi:DNA repair exonuclease SbcCD ATPase subunit
MDDAERQRTMDFILQHQAHFAAGMQRLEEQQSRFAEQQAKFTEQQSKLSEHQVRADARIDQLKRIVLQMMLQFRRERGDLRERIAALVDSQMRTEEAIRSLTATTESLTATTERNSKDIASLSRKAGGSNGDEGEGGGAPY